MRYSKSVSYTSCIVSWVYNNIYCYILVLDLGVNLKGNLKLFYLFNLEATSSSIRQLAVKLNSNWMQTLAQVQVLPNW